MLGDVVNLKQNKTLSRKVLVIDLEKRVVKIKLKLLYETVYSQERLKQNSKCFTGK